MIRATFVERRLQLHGATGDVLATSGRRYPELHLLLAVWSSVFAVCGQPCVFIDGVVRRASPVFTVAKTAQQATCRKGKLELFRACDGFLVALDDMTLL